MKSILCLLTQTRSTIHFLLGLTIVLLLGGCRICADCEDLDYPAYGGAWQRTLRQSGRVGSVFDPAGSKAATLVDRTEPESTDAMERSRQQDNETDSDPDHDGSDHDGSDRDGSDRDDASGSEDDGERESLRDREDELREKSLDDIEDDREDELRGKSLDDIEVRIVPGQPPVMVNSM